MRPRPPDARRGDRRARRPRSRARPPRAGCPRSPPRTPRARCRASGLDAPRGLLTVLLAPRRSRVFVGRDEVAIPTRARLRHAFERGVVDVHDPEALRIAVRPLEV